MGKIASELLVERLADWGVDTVFGLPGDGINGLMEGFRRHQDRIRFVLVHHEEAAAFMATGYAKVTGKLGVCVATSGPGGIHLMNGLYDAKLDHVPVLAITGAQATPQLGTAYQQEVHLEKVFMDLCVYNEMFHAPVSVGALTDIAIRAALSRRGVAHLTFPVDMQEADPTEGGFGGGLDTTRAPKIAPGVYDPPRILPSMRALESAAEVLNGAERIVLFVGVGARHAKAQVREVADTLGAPIVTTLPAKMVVPDDDPHLMGGLGLLGTSSSEYAIGHADALFLLGTNFPYTRWLPTELKSVQIELEPVRLGNRVPLTAGLVGDVAETLRALAPMLERKEDRSFLERCQARRRRWVDELHGLEDKERDPIRPQYLMSLIDRYASDDAILASDSGTIATWAARHFRIKGTREFYLSGNLATMAPGLPYAMAAACADPARQAIAFVGDGGFAMLMAEFHTAVWHRLPIKVCVCNNGVLGQILWEQMALGYPESNVRFGSFMDFAPWAQSCGGKGVRVSDPAQLEGAVREWLASPEPALLDVVVNADEAPLPPKPTVDEMRHFAASLLKGTNRRTQIVQTIGRDAVDQLRGALHRGGGNGD